jgi:hypothetical protein
MSDSATTQLFKLSTGGLYYTLLLRFGIIKEGKYRIGRLILLFIAITWLPLFILAALEGNLYRTGVGISYFTDINPHVRFLIAIPILLFAGKIIDPLIGAVVQHIKTSGLIAESSRAQFSQALANMGRRRDSIWADIIFIFIAAIISTLARPGYGETELEKVSTWLWVSDGNDLSVTLAGWWYFILAAPLAQIVLYRWLWRYMIWIGFLYHVSRIKLALLSTHGDLTGGLGILFNGQFAFVVIFVAFGSLLSAGLANEMLADGSSMKEISPIIYGIVIAQLIVIVAPLLLFSKQLFNAKRQARRQYGALGYRLSKAFDNKWNREDAPMEQGKDILTAVDPSALADYNAIYETISGMHIFPMKIRTVGLVAIILAVPFVPLILIEVPLDEVLSRVLNALA